MRISVVIPVYNSSKILFDSYINIKDSLEKITNDYEILFRNDASIDRSEDSLKGISKVDRKVKVFSNPVNRGLGFTLGKLFKDARGDFIVYLDADAYRCFNLSLLSDFLKVMEDDTDVVVASRYKTAGKQIPLYRIAVSNLYNTISRFLFRISVEDIGSGFVVFKKKVLANINLESEGFDIHIEIFTKAKRAGFKIKEIAVTYKHWYGGSFDVLKHGPKTLFRTLNLWYKIVVLKK